MDENPPVMESLPEKPLTEAHIRELGESDAVIGAMSFPGEQEVRGFVLEHEDSFSVLVFDHRTDTWRKLNRYDKDDLSLATVIQWAVDDRTEWSQVQRREYSDPRFRNSPDRLPIVTVSLSVRGRTHVRLLFETVSSADPCT